MKDILLFKVLKLFVYLLTHIVPNQYVFLLVEYCSSDVIVSVQKEITIIITLFIVYMVYLSNTLIWAIYRIHLLNWGVLDILRVTDFECSVEGFFTCMQQENDIMCMVSYAFNPLGVRYLAQGDISHFLPVLRIEPATFGLPV